MIAWSILNMLASSSIIVLTMVNWKSFSGLNALQQFGVSASATFCGCIVLKAGWYLSMSEFNSDVFGILFRCAWVVYLIGVAQKNSTKTEDPWLSNQKHYSRDSVFSS